MSSDTPSRLRRLRVLIIPEQFPRAPDDIAGIFVRDYIESIKPHCDVAVLMPGNEHRAGVTGPTSGGDGVDYITCTPRIRTAGRARQKLGRLEGLYRLGQTARFFRDIDLVHAHGAVFHGAPAATLGRRLGVPVVLTVHTGPFSKLLEKRAMRFITRRTLERVDCVCPVSEDLRRQIEESGIRPRRIVVTHNPVDTELFRPASSGEIRRRIVFAGRLEEYKGALRAARAFAEVAERLPGWTLSIAGEGPELPKLDSFRRAHPALHGRVELLGRCTKSELAELFASSALFVYPSRHESFGLVIAEAMSAGLPVVAPDRTAPPEFVDDTSGVLVPPDDVAAIAHAIAEIAEGHSRFDREAIREGIVRRFGFEAFGRRMLELYLELAPGPNRREYPCAG